MSFDFTFSSGTEQLDALFEELLTFDTAIKIRTTLTAIREYLKGDPSSLNSIVQIRTMPIPHLLRNHLELVNQFLSSKKDMMYLDLVMYSLTSIVQDLPDPDSQDTGNVLQTFFAQDFPLDVLQKILDTLQPSQEKFEDKFYWLYVSSCMPLFSYAMRFITMAACNEKPHDDRLIKAIVSRSYLPYLLIEKESRHDPCEVKQNWVRNWCIYFRYIFLFCEGVELCPWAKRHEQLILTRWAPTLAAFFIYVKANPEDTDAVEQCEFFRHFSFCQCQACSWCKTCQSGYGAAVKKALKEMFADETGALGNEYVQPSSGPLVRQCL